MRDKPVMMVLSSHTHSLFWFRTDMMKMFTEKGFRIVAVGQESEKEWKDKFSEFNVEYRQIYVSRNGTNPIDDLKTLKCIYDLIGEYKPDKIFCYQAKTVIYGCLAAKLNGIKEVYPLIAGLGSIFRSDGVKNKLLKILMSFEYWFSLKFAKSVMFQNNDDLGVFVRNKIVDKRKCGIINGSGVNIEKFSVSSIPEDNIFLMITRLIKDKGTVEYLEAAEIIKNKYPEAKFLLVGPYDTNPSAVSPETVNEYIQKGIIEYFGEQTNVKPYLDLCSVYVLPSYHEGTPKTVLEAMACGRAVITTDAPGCRETVKDGVNGLLVKVKDVNGLVMAMEELINNHGLCVEMGKNGRKIVEDKYDVNKVNLSILRYMNIL